MGFNIEIVDPKSYIMHVPKETAEGGIDAILVHFLAKRIGEILPGTILSNGSGLIWTIFPDDVAPNIKPVLEHLSSYIIRKPRRQRLLVFTLQGAVRYFFLKSSCGAGSDASWHDRSFMMSFQWLFNSSANSTTSLASRRLSVLYLPATRLMTLW